MEINELEDKISELEDSIELANAKIGALVEIIKEFSDMDKPYEMNLRCLRRTLNFYKGVLDE